MTPSCRFALAMPFALLAASTGHAQTLEVAAGDKVIEVSAPDEGVLRIRMLPPGGREGASWAVDPGSSQGVDGVSITGDTLSTSTLQASVDRQTLKVTVTGADGRVIVSDAAAPTLSPPGFELHKLLTQSEHIFAFGDKTGGLDRRGKSFVNWDTDSFGFQAADDPIYKSIPFYLSVGGAQGAYGLFLDNTYRSWFDFGHRRAGEIAIGAEDGPIDYYVIAGPRPADVVRRYTRLTGRAPLPPRWVLGYQQSRWSYMSEAEVRVLAERLRAERVPTDVIWLDIDFQDRNRPFTIDRKTFPHFEEMVKDLAARGISTVAITDLHIAAAPGQGYAPYDSGVAGDHFLRTAEGTMYVAPVWPGPSVFPEFTSARTRAWWGGLFRQLVDAGVAGVWNDMDEPAIFETPTKTMPLDVRHRIAGDGMADRTTDHREIHNVYGMLNSRATFEGLLALRPDERPFVMTRASFAGGQRYAATWTGDNSSTWDHLKLSVAQTLNLGLSGFAWSGADVGGFTGGPSPELLTRWFEYAAFAPIFRDHSQKGVPRAEPWVDGPEQLAIRRHYVEERYRLLPFLYAQAEAGSRSGDPLMRPVFYDYPDVIGADCDMSMQFTIGGVLLVAGAPKPESPAVYPACLPAGEWYDYWTGQAVAGRDSGNPALRLLDLTPSLAVLPVFIRGGTALPRQPLVQSTAERPEGPLELDIYPGNGCAGDLYDDDGHSLDYRRGAFFRQAVRCEGVGDTLSSVTFEASEGRLRPWWSAVQVTIHGARQAPSSATRPVSST